MKGFLNNLYLRPSCYHCAARQGKSGADISIADYWGVNVFHAEIKDDDKGFGLEIINTEKGLKINNILKSMMDIYLSEYNKAIKSNPCVVKSVKNPRERKLFWKMYAEDSIGSIEVVCNMIKPSLITTIKIFVKSVVKRLIKL